MANQSQTDVAIPTFDEFPPVSYADWRKAAEKALKGAPFEKRLITKTYENIDLQPIYRQENLEGLPHLGGLPGFAPYVRSTTPLAFVAQSWDVAQEIACGTPAAFNAAVQADLTRGQTAINLVLDHPTLHAVDADQAVTVGGNRTQSVTGDESLTVSGSQTESVTGSRTTTVTGDDALTVAGSRTVAVTGDQGLTIQGAQSTAE